MSGPTSSPPARCSTPTHEDLWRDIERSGELRADDGKYQAIAEFRLLAGMLRGSAFEAVYGPQDEG